MTPLTLIPHPCPSPTRRGDLAFLRGVHTTNNNHHLTPLLLVPEASLWERGAGGEVGEINPRESPKWRSASHQKSVEWVLSPRKGQACQDKKKRLSFSGQPLSFITSFINIRYTNLRRLRLLRVCYHRRYLPLFHPLHPRVL